MARAEQLQKAKIALEREYCVCVYMHVHARTSLQGCISMYKSMCVKGRFLSLGVFLNHSPPCFFETGSLTKPGSHQFS